MDGGVADGVPSVDNSPVGSRCSDRDETSSPMLVAKVGQVQVVGGKDPSTEQARTAGSTTCSIWSPRAGPTRRSWCVAARPRPGTRGWPMAAQVPLTGSSQPPCAVRTTRPPSGPMVTCLLRGTRCSPRRTMPLSRPGGPCAAAWQSPSCRTGAYGEGDVVTFDAWELEQQCGALSADPDLVPAAVRNSGRDAAVAAYGSRGARILDLYAEFQASELSWPT